jgi:hypothetical protein
MSLINSQVVLGEPMLADPLMFQDPGYRRMGRVERLGVLEPAAPAVRIEEVGGLLGGTGLLIGSSFVEGKGSIIMAILGGLGIVVAGYSVLSRMMSAPAPAAGTGLMPAGSAPPPPVKPTSPIQNAASMVQAFAPVIQQALPMLKNLFDTKPAAPAPSSSPAIVTSYSQLQPTPAPSSGPSIVTSYDDLA